RPPSPTLFPYTTLFRSAAATAVRDHVHGAVCVSRRIEEDLVARHGFSRASIGTIANATDLPLAEARRPPLEEAPLRILSLGRVEDRKSTRLNSSHVKIS